MSKVRLLGFDVHAGTISVEVAEMGGEVHSICVIANRLESILNLMHRLGPVQHLRATSSSKNASIRTRQVIPLTWSGSVPSPADAPAMS
jgi:hypothetical protein